MMIDDIIIDGEDFIQIDYVKAKEYPFIEIRFKNEDEKYIVDLSSLIEKFKFYKILRNNQELFNTVRVAESHYNFAIIWGEELDMNGETIRRLIREAKNA